MPVPYNRSIEEDHSYRKVVYSIFQRPLPVTRSGGQAIALVGAHRFAGTTYVAGRLTRYLNTCGPSSSAVSVDCRELARAGWPHQENHFGAEWPSQIELPRRNWYESREAREEYLRRLKASHSSVLLDCPSLHESVDVLGLAPLVDGVLLVVAANETTKKQIDFLERSIESVGGKIAGHVLNKRTYPIPDWAHKRLEAWGI